MGEIFKPVPESEKQNKAKDNKDSNGGGFSIDLNTGTPIRIPPPLPKGTLPREKRIYNGQIVEVVRIADTQTQEETTGKKGSEQPTSIVPL